MNHEPGLERQLRAMLHRHAADAPHPGTVAGRVLHAADAASAAAPRDEITTRRWWTWSLPVAAAAIVAAVVATLAAAGAFSPNGERGHQAPALSPTVLPSLSSGPERITSPGPAPTTHPTTPPGGVGGPAVLDLSFVGNDEGFALAARNCAAGALGCTQLLHTTNGGARWTASPLPAPARVDACVQQAKCLSLSVDHLRFATQQVGYVWGTNDGPFLMTTDGGRSWLRDSVAVHVAALETLSGNVIRIVNECGCAPGARFTVQVAAVGSSAWRTVATPTALDGDSVVLTRVHHLAALLVRQNPAGGAGSARSTLLVSGDDGASWRDRGEPCPQGAPSGQAGGEVDTVAATTAPDGSVVALCTPRGGAGGSFVIVSTDEAASFRPAPATLGASPGTLIAAASARTIFVLSDALYRSADGGATWTRVQQNSTGPLVAAWIGFESTSVGRALEGSASTEQHTLWTTVDGGLTWTSRPIT